MDERTFKMIRQLSELADRGVEFAQHLRRQVALAETPRAKADLAAAYLAIARSVRNTVALEVKLIREARGLPPRRRTTSRPTAGDDLDAPAMTVPPDVVKH